MSTSKRKALIRTVERIAVTLFVLDVVAYGVLVLGVGKRNETASRLRDDLLRQHQDIAKRVKRLEHFQASLPDAKKSLEEFMQVRVPTRRQGYSTAARLIREVAQKSGVNISGVSYKLGSEQKEPLERLAVTVNAEGLYPGLIKFGRSLETASDFIVVREFTFTQGDGGILALRLSADLYLSP